MSTTTIFTLCAIALGGALGALSRYGVNVLSLHAWGADFPYGTFIVNVLGSFIMGLAIASFAHFWQPPKLFSVFLVTGFLGAFTTFSTFSLDISVLYERGAYLSLAGYFIGSITISVIALFSAMALVRALAS